MRKRISSEGHISTIKEVAEKAGVSVSTVSHVINGTRFVSDDLKNKVLSVMECLDYQPNRIARSLRKKQTNSLGLIVADITNPFYSEIAWSIEYLSYIQNYSVMLCNSDGDPEKEQFYLNQLSQWQVDGIILVSSMIFPTKMISVGDGSLPIILIDHDCPGYDFDTVLIDDFYAGKLATEHLIQLGHQRIACITGSKETIPSYKRVYGYKAALEAAGLEYDPALVVRGDFNIISGVNCTNRLLELENRPTAIFACNDLMAMGVMQSAYVKGLRIPDDLSVVGLDDIYWSKYTVPPLTTIKLPVHQLAEEAVKSFLSRVESPDKASRTVTLEVHLENRASTGPLKNN
ncbi:MAG: LacI family transcriptional regulator [Chloroflexota bacterium]|nr:LacI family transcriptional regulator [Chloroflexota bacterium]